MVQPPRSAALAPALDPHGTEVWKSDRPPAPSVAQTTVSETDAGDRLSAGVIGSARCLINSSWYLCLRDVWYRRVVIQYEYADWLCACLHRRTDPRPSARRLESRRL